MPRPRDQLRGHEEADFAMSTEEQDASAWWHFGSSLGAIEKCVKRFYSKGSGNLEAPNCNAGKRGVSTNCRAMDARNWLRMSSWVSVICSRQGLHHGRSWQTWILVRLNRHLDLRVLRR